MLETLNSDIDKRILKEVRVQTREFRTTGFGTEPEVSGFNE
jgi:hypothetical protein